MNQKHFFTDDALSVLTRIVSDIKNPVRKVLAVTGKSSYDVCGARTVIDGLKSELDLEISRFANFSVNPQYEDLQNGLDVMRGTNPDIIIAIGGGSVIDMAKLMRYYHADRNDMNAFQSRIPLIAIPTTAGTGSEATHFAVLYKEGKKSSIADESIQPDFAIIDSSFTYGIKRYETACTGFDALAQAIEAYWNKNATEESDSYALKALELLWTTLPDVCKNPNSELRRRMSEGAYWAGRAINITKTTAPHAFSYPFTSYYGIPHGHAVAITFPFIADYNFLKGQITDKKKETMINIFGSGKIYNIFHNCIYQLGLVIPSRSYDVNKILEGISIERLANNPADINSEDALNIINKAIKARH